MKIIFNLEYQTTFGEELAVNILLDGKTEQHKMGTLDGLHWTCELSKAVKTTTFIDYYYTVMRGEDECRTVDSRRSRIAAIWAVDSSS